MIDPTLYEGYIGPNQAHIRFKQEIGNAKVLTYLVQGSRDRLKNEFLKAIGSRAGREKFAIGLVVETLAPDKVRLLNIPKNEAELVSTNYESLESQFLALLYIDVHRIFENYLIDLF